MVVLGVAARRTGVSPWRPAWPYPETIGCLALAVLYRLPAILHPLGWVNRDGAYGAFVALHLRQGIRPAPVFTEGANYQGTLKGHLAALFHLLGVRDLPLGMLLASVVLYLAFIVATMALVRRVAGRPAAAFAGLFLAVSSRFVTVFSLNCVGQYVDVLALGGMALALLAALLAEDDEAPARARLRAAAAGWLLGAAFWQQPVALAYGVAGVLALALRRRSFRDGAIVLLLLGALVGVLPVLLWNAQNDWASGDILGRDPGDLAGQIDAVPRLARRTATISFPILAGLTPGHPWSETAVARGLAVALIPGALVAFLALTRGGEARALLRGRPQPAMLAPLLLLACVALFWAAASGKVYWRPRYLLPVVAATAVHLGAALGWSWRRAPAAAAAGMAALLALHVAGTWERLERGAAIGAYYRSIVRSLEAKRVRTGYADFSISAPVTMATAERILLSSRLGPTPAYESALHADRVAREGPDAFVLPAGADPAPFAAGLDALGVRYRLDIDPVPVFHSLSRRVRLEEVIGLVGEASADADAE